MAEGVEPAEPASEGSRREEPIQDRGEALLRSLAERRFLDLEGEQLEKLREPRHLSIES